MKASKKPKIKGAQFYKVDGAFVGTVHPRISNISQMTIIKVGDKVETIKPGVGAWFSADIIDISPNSKCECHEECQCIYKLVLEGDDDNLQVLNRTLNEIRQVSYSSIDWDKLEVGMKVVINYNIDQPKQWGFWYDYIIEDIQKRKDVYYLSGTLLVGKDGSSKKLPVKIDSDNVADVLEIRPHATLEEKEMEFYETGVKPEYCKKCRNKPKIRCRVCCCCKCGTKKDLELTIQCDECTDWYHIYCIKPPIKEIPKDEDWYCPKCDNKAKCAKLEMKQRQKKQRKLNRSRAKSSGNKAVKTLKDTGKVCEEKETATVISECNYCDDVGMIEVTKDIEKDSCIWNQVKELFPGYDLVKVMAKVRRKESLGVISSAAEEFILNDVVNQHLWEEAKQSLSKGKKEFLESVKRIFTCSICCELLNDPITLSCKHSFCIDCFFRSLSVNVYNCALCRVHIIQTQHYVVNENLKGALDLLFGKKIKNSRI